MLNHFKSNFSVQLFLSSIVKYIVLSIYRYNACANNLVNIALFIFSNIGGLKSTWTDISIVII